MRVFVTGATGFIGSALVLELIGAGHHVLGMTRSEAGAKALAAAGAEAHRGTLEDLESLTSGASQSDGVVHLAFDHDFTSFENFTANCQKDKRAIEALGVGLAHTNRPLIVSSGIGPWTPGKPVTEDVDPPAGGPMPRVSEETAVALLSGGVSTAVMRLPQVHDTVKQGLVTPLVAIAREKGSSGYVAEGRNRWPAAHVTDVARLYRLALEQHRSGTKYHAVAEEGVATRDIAEALGRGLNVPVVSIAPADAGAHFGFLGMFASLDLSASSAITQERLGWKPTGPGMIADLNGMNYSAN